VEILGLIVIFAALVAIVESVRVWQANRVFPTKPMSLEEEAQLIRRVLSQPDGKKVSLIIYWVDTLKLLTYAERKALEQTGQIVSLTPHEVLLGDPVSGRKIAVKRMGDPAAPQLLN
jgi:hypothetical protein